MDATYDYTYTTGTTAADSGLIAAILGFMAAMWLVIMVIGIIMIISMWKIFTKAGKPGWAALIPIYNLIVLLEVVEKPVWWILLFFVPFANFVVQILIYLELANKFGKDALFAIFGLILFPVIGFPMLAFGKAQYNGAAAPAAAPATPTETPQA